MKKKLFFVGLMLALSLGASAQDQEFSFGLRLGPNFNWIGSRAGAAENHGDKSGTDVGFDLGFVAEYYFTENYALVTGVNVNFLRGQYDFADKRVIGNDTILGVVDRKFKSTVFEIPLMFKMVTPDKGYLPLGWYFRRPIQSGKG